MLDTDDQIHKKVRKAVTDSLGPISVDPEERPGVYNLLKLLAEVSDQELEVVCDNYVGENIVDLKKELAECLVERLLPVREEAVRLLGDRGYIDDVLEKGADKARGIAEVNLDDIYRTLGLQ